MIQERALIKDRVLIICSKNRWLLLDKPRGEGAGGRGQGSLGSIFVGHVSLASQNPLPHYSLFLVYFVANYRPHLSHFWPFIVYFWSNFIPHLSHFLANDFLNLKVPKNCDPILVTLLKRPEKGAPTSGTSQ